jgi:hypothetical protein
MSEIEGLRLFAGEFWQHAKEALRWASQSKTEKEKNAMIDLARTWALAALSAERRLVPGEVSAPSQGQAPGGVGWPPRELKRSI